MKKGFILLVIAMIAASCGNNTKSREFLQEQPEMEDYTEETIVSSVGEANAARFVLEKDDEVIGVNMDPGNLATAVLRGPEIGRLLMQGRWEIIEDQYKLTVIAPLCTEDEATIIMIPKSFDKGFVVGDESEYKLTNLELIKYEKAEERGPEENDAKEYIKKFYLERLFDDEKYLYSHCSPKLIKKLRDAYYEGDEGLATWSFASGDQEGPNYRHEIVNVESEGNNWYRYDFYDMGIKGSHRVKLLLNSNNEMIIDDLQ